MAGTAFKRALMCRPTHFAVKYKINHWMGGTVDQKLAMKQWEHLKCGLESCGVKVDVIEQAEDLPDMVFVCNAGIAHGKNFYLAHFRHPERQGERTHYEKWVKENDFNVSGGTDNYFEGGGDAYFQHSKLLLAGSGFRTSPDVYQKIHESIGKDQFKVLMLEMVDERFYHLDTCLCALSDTQALWFPPAFSADSQAKLRASGLQLLAVSEKDAEKFACNAITAGKTVFLPAGCEDTEKLLKSEGFNVINCDTSEFLKGGGSCQCLVLKL